MLTQISYKTQIYLALEITKNKKIKKWLLFKNNNIINTHKILTNMMTYKIWMILIHIILNNFYKKLKVKTKLIINKMMKQNTQQKHKKIIQISYKTI